MARILQRLSGVLVGIVLGVALAIFLQQPQRQWAVLHVLIALCGLGILLVVAYLIGRAMLHRYQRELDLSWIQTLSVNLLAGTYDPAARSAAAEQLVNGKTQVRNLVRLILAFLGLHHALATVILLLGSVVGVATLMTAYMQVERLDRQNALLTLQNEKLDTQNQLAEAGRRAGLAFELTSILDVIDQERRSAASSGATVANTSGSKFTPSSGVVGRIVALSRSLRPYRYLDWGTQVSAREGEEPRLSRIVSPERAQLLFTLLSSNINLEPLIISGADFSSADLNDANLFGVDLSGERTGIQLARSDFLDAALTQADLSRAQLHGANFMNADMVRTVLFKADLYNALFWFADLRCADLRMSNLQEADFWAANLDSASLVGARLPTAKRFSGASLAGVNLEGAIPPSADWLQELRQLDDAPRGLDWSAWQILEVPESLQLRGRKPVPQDQCKREPRRITFD